MSDWIRTLWALARSGTPTILVTVVAAKGSVPRAPGTRMLVTSDAIHGTIGGGHLEFKAIDIARDLLATGSAATLQRFPLGASLGQCCGGLAQLLFEPVHGLAQWLDALVQAQASHTVCALVTLARGEEPQGHLLVTADEVAGTFGSAARDGEATEIAREALAGRGEARLLRLGASDADTVECFVDVLRPPELRLVLFGAGHVGRAIVRVLAGVQCRITWVDTRDEAFPADVSSHVDCVATDVPEAEVAAAPPGACFLVMTHSHALDETLAEHILARDDFAYFGLIGSASKRRQFERRLASRGVERSRLDRMTCPIGVAGIRGKEPDVIAIAVAAQLLQVSGHEAAATQERTARCA